MSIKNTMSAISPAEASTLTIIRQRGNWLLFLRSPLWICLILALSVRIWLVIHTHGIIEGDEALVGIQAQHILQGEHPIYFYAQPYMAWARIRSWPAFSATSWPTSAAAITSGPTSPT